MIIKLKTQQFQVISEFSNDLAKGLMLAAILGQGIVENTNVFLKILNTLFIALLGLVFLYLGVKFRKKI